MRFLALFVYSIGLLPIFAQGRSWDFEYSNGRIHDVEILDAASPLHFRVTGKDPYLYLLLKEKWNGSTRSETPPPVLELEYFSGEGSDHLQVFTSPGESEHHSVKGGGLPISQGWSRYRLDLGELDLAGLHQAGSWKLRLDFGTRVGSEFKIQRIQLTERTAQEALKIEHSAALEERDRLLTEQIADYLQRFYTARVEQVQVGVEKVQVRYAIHESVNLDSVRLFEIPMGFSRWEILERDDALIFSHSLSHPTSIEISRKRNLSSSPGEDLLLRLPDRLLSRWALAQKVEGESEWRWISAARYAEDPEPVRNPEPLLPANRKGIGALSMGRPVQDLDKLGVGSATVNFHLSNVLRTTPTADTQPFVYMGREWHAVQSTLRNWDAALLEAAKRNIVVSAILLVPHAHQFSDRAVGQMVGHPEADRAGIFAAPNLENPEGALAYSAIIELLAQRYCRSDGKYGRVSHWIIHNEVNSGWVWTNAGERSALRFMDLYQKSVRLTHLISRQYDPDSLSFLSLEHHWTVTHNNKCYRGRELLEWMEKFCRTEGDFEWALAFHPYPQSLFEPKVWLDRQAHFDFETPKITFKNLEVLDVWMRRPEALYGTQQRVIHLTEQGLNSRDYSEKSLLEQAAGMAYAWKKMEPLESIKVFHYHNWVDNRHEGGLRIGLRRFPDDETDPMGKKPVYEVFQALGTEREAAAIEFAKDVIGIEDWAEIDGGMKFR